MIRVTEHEGYIRITGHAGKPPDLVCEDVTALMCSLILSIQKLTDDEIIVTVEKGNALLTYGYLSERARLLIDSFFVGVDAVANKFPDRVQASRLEDEKSEEDKREV